MPGHYGTPEHHIVSVSSPVATQILHAVGIALAAQDPQGADQVAVAIMGEGSSNQGDVHEALNFAAIHKLPFVFIVENNGYAISVPAEKELSVKDVASPGVRLRDARASIVDGTDVLACYAAGREAVERARAGGGPTLIEAKVTRLTAHSSDDQQTKYRSDDGPRGGHAPRTRCRSSATSCATAGVLDRRDRGGAARPRSPRSSRTRPTTPRPSPTRTRSTALDHVYARAVAGRAAAAVAPGAGQPQQPTHPGAAAESH